MTLEEAKEKIENTVKEINEAGFVVLLGVCFEDGYGYEAITVESLNVVNPEDENG